MTEKTEKTIIRLFWIILTLPFALVLFAVLLVWIFAEIPSFKELEHPDSKMATQILADGGELLTTFHIENRTFVDYEDISPNVVHAAVATEDSRFYQHSGIDFRGLGRVAFKTLLLGDRNQGGGSTITQQLAKTLYPRKETGGKLGMVIIKLKEWITAVKIERNYTKDEIMDMYLNSIFFGSGAYGIQTAAETFFAKKPKDLTVEEAATLIGMINKPTRYSPVLNPDKSLARRNFVLGQMEKAGYLNSQQRDSISQIPIKIPDFRVADHNAGIALYLRDMLRRDMNARKPRRSDYKQIDDYRVDSLRWEEDALYGWLNKTKKANGTSYNIDRDGLKIYTTINYKMQKYAEDAVAEHLGGYLQSAFWRDLKYRSHPPFSNGVSEKTRDLLMNQARRWSDRYMTMKEEGAREKDILSTFSVPTRMRVFAWNSKGYKDTTMTPDDSIRYYKSFLRAGVMAIQPGTGHVKAYVGGPNYRYFKYDQVSQGRRQIGSTVKPFIYSLALTEGMRHCDEVANVPQTFEVPGAPKWTPKQAGGGGILTLKMGLTTSNNNISAFLMKQFGPKAIVAHMHRMGVGGYIEEVYPLCVGSADVCVKDMVSAYNTFPSKGIYMAPLFVTRIEDANGNVISEFTNKKKEALSMDVTYEMIDMMQSVVNNGTGRRLRYAPYNLTCEIGGKTGTTNDNSDGWFIGYTPVICAGVWVGAEDRQVHFSSTGMGQGASMALPIFGRFLKKCINDGSLGISSSDKFVIPQGVDTDRGCKSGGIFLGGNGSDGSAADSLYYDDTEEYYFN